MPLGKLSLAAALILIASACIRPQPIDVIDGVPFSKRIDGSSVEYDGRGLIVVQSEFQKLAIPVRAPAQLLFSPSSDRIVINFGNGSGQVLDFEVYDLQHAEKIPVAAFKDEVLQMVTRNCDIHPDEISFVVQRWVSESQLRVKTENWSRRSACDELDRSWIANFPRSQ